jgi:hypothetical protein
VVLLSSSLAYSLIACFVSFLQYEVEMGSSTYYARVERKDGEMRGAHTNRAWTGKLVSDDLAVVVTDFVDDDDNEGADAGNEACEGEVGSDGVPLVSPQAKAGLRIDTCMMLTIARVEDPETHEPVVLMRRLRMHRYNLPPNSPVLHRELNKLLSYFNGDFHMAMLSDAYMNLSTDDQSCDSARSEAGDKKAPEQDEEESEETEDEDVRSAKKQKRRPAKQATASSPTRTSSPSDEA